MHSEQSLAKKRVKLKRYLVAVGWKPFNEASLEELQRVVRSIHASRSAKGRLKRAWPMTKSKIEQEFTKARYANNLFKLKVMFGKQADMGCVIDSPKSKTCKTVADLIEIGWVDPSFAYLDQLIEDYFNLSEDIPGPKVLDIPNPIVELTNGIRVCNFSSAHSFEFDDGTVLPGCHPDYCRAMALQPHEVTYHTGKWTDIQLKFTLTEVVQDELEKLQKNADIDIILVALPVIQALKDSHLPIGKCRTIRKVDRASSIIHSDRFCR